MCVYVLCMKSLNAYDCLCLIMIDVKLTLSGFDRLPVCMNG